MVRADIEKTLASSYLYQIDVFLYAQSICFSNKHSKDNKVGYDVKLQEPATVL